MVDSTIEEMELAVSASQNASLALTMVSDTFWNTLQAALPASQIPSQLTRTPSFQEARQPTSSGGSSPMDTSLDGILPPPRHHDALVTPLPAFGDLPDAPIVLSSDSDSPQVTPVAALPPYSSGAQVEAPVVNEIHASASPPLLRFAKRCPTWTMKCGCNRW
jgi:hypothetical protein